MEKKFYTPNQFRNEDIKYVAKLLRLKKKPDLTDYSKSTYVVHRPKILSVLRHLPFKAQNQEFKVSTREEQEIALSCRHSIKNSIVLWNYMSISQKLSNVKDREEHEIILDLLRGSSIMTWQHINMLGEYNFEISKRKLPFDIEKILNLKISA